MRIAMTLAFGLAALLGPSRALSQDHDNAIIRSFSMDDIGRFMGMMQGSMASVREGPRPTDLSATLTYEGGETADFTAMNCGPAADLMRRACTHFLIVKSFEVKDARTARQLAEQFNAAWYADTASDNRFVIRRMDWIDNGVTQRHLGSAIHEFRRGVDLARRAVAEADSAN